jgi:hypothetical protein
LIGEGFGKYMNKWGQAPFSAVMSSSENVFFLTKWGLSPFILGQKQRVLKLYSLSLSSMAPATISQNLCPDHSNQLSRK